MGYRIDGLPNLLGRTIVRWANHISHWHGTSVIKGPSEAINNLIRRVRRVAFGFRRPGQCRIRAPLYAGRPF